MCQVLGGSRLPIIEGHVTVGLSYRLPVCKDRRVVALKAAVNDLHCGCVVHLGGNAGPGWKDERMGVSTRLSTQVTKLVGFSFQRR